MKKGFVLSIVICVLTVLLMISGCSKEPSETAVYVPETTAENSVSDESVSASPDVAPEPSGENNTDTEEVPVEEDTVGLSEDTKEEDTDLQTDEDHGGGVHAALCRASHPEEQEHIPRGGILPCFRGDDGAAALRERCRGKAGGDRLPHKLRSLQERRFADLRRMEGKRYQKDEQGRA